MKVLFYTRRLGIDLCRVFLYNEKVLYYLRGEKMSGQLDGALEKFKEQAPELIKDNKGALIGAALGYFLFSGDEKAQSALLAAVAGSLLIDKKKDEE